MALCTAATVWGEYADAPDGGLMAMDIAFGIASCGLMVLMLLRRPVTGALAIAALAVFSPAATPPSTVGTLYVARVRPFPIATGVAVAGVIAHVLRGLWLPVDGISFGWWVVLVMAAHAALLGWGSMSRARHALIAALTDRARRAEEEQGRRVAEARAAERARIAREMHDVLAHRLSLLATYAGALEYRPDAPPERLAHAAGVVRASVHQALDELRDVIALLRDDPGDTGHDIEAQQPPQAAFADVPGLVEESRTAGMRVRLRNEVADPASMPDGTGRAAFRIVQEGLTNARKHAAGQPVALRLDGTPGDALVIEISNPVPAHEPPQPSLPGAGTGLVGLTERARLAGGRLDHRRTSEDFSLRASLPWPS